jgi:hypothetical protein
MIVKRNYFSLPMLLILSTFGPYIFKQYGIRTDHMMLYLSFLCVCCFSSLKNKFLLKKEMKAILYILILLFLIPFVMLSVNMNITLKMLASIENYLQPIVVIIVSCYYFSRKQIRIDEMIHLFLFLLCLNTILSLLSIFIDINEFISLFVRGSERGGMPIALGVMSQSRFTGIFNQPFTAGLAYSVGLLLIVYLFSHQKIGLSQIVYTIIVFVGGIITVSKVFFPLGVFIALYMLILYRKYNTIMSIIFLLFLLVPTISLFWDNNYFFRLLIPPTNISELLELYTSGRLGVSNVNLHYVNNIYDDSFLIGYGYATDVYAPDSAYVDYLSQSGIIGVFLYIVLLINLGFSIYRYKTNLKSKILLKGFFLLLIFSGIGAPVLTINRVSIIIIVFITALFYQRNSIS